MMAGKFQNAMTHSKYIIQIATFKVVVYEHLLEALYTLNLWVYIEWNSIFTYINTSSVLFIAVLSIFL